MQKRVMSGSTDFASAGYGPIKLPGSAQVRQRPRKTAGGGKTAQRDPGGKREMDMAFMDYQPVLTPSYQRAKERFAPKTFRTMDEMAFDGLEFNSMGIPILDEMDYSTMPLDATMVNFAKRRLGKSFLTRWLSYHFGGAFPRGLVFSSTESLNRFYQQFIPKRFIINGFREDILQAFLDLQYDLVTMWADAEQDGIDLGLPDNWERAFVIFDDCIDNMEIIRHSRGLQTISVAGRHYHVWSIFNTQYSFALTPAIKKNTDIANMFATNDVRDKEALWETFGQMFQDEALFYRTLAFYTRNNMVLVANLSDSKEMCIKNIYHWAKADEVPDFKLGNKQYWEGADRQKKMSSADRIDTMPDEGKLPHWSEVQQAAWAGDNEMAPPMRAGKKKSKKEKKA